MRLRAIVTAAAFAMTLVMAVPGQASAAAGGIFHYTYTNTDGVEMRGDLENPATNTCVTIPEADDVANPGAKPAHSPSNKTNVDAILFADVACDEAEFAVAVNGKGGSNLKFRAVRFDT
ncbi:hypothetical protein SNS2_2165 [Streptomyces netropsis]|nr:hypothetical protein SNS2_2165 [Streptomyces netropsis]